MKSVMTPQEHFASIESPKIKRSTFDRSHGVKTCFDAGLVIPFYVDEALPGDTMNLSATVFGRINTLLKPIMDNVFIDVHFFSVPERLLWTNWQRFNGEQDNPDDTTDFIMPVMTSTAVTGYGENSIYDYLGLPTKVPGLEHRADILRGYNLIWKEWYRDQNLQDSPPINLGDGPDDVADYVVLPRGKRKDYFTSALPWAQKADPVVIPLGTTAPVTLNPLSGALPNWKVRVSSTGAINTVGQAIGSSGAGAVIDNNAGTQWSLDPNGGLRVDLSQASAITINALRESSQVQVLYELDARGGTRYIELLRVHFGVVSPDARLQRPEFLGGFTVPVNVSPVAQTAPTTGGSTPQGNLAAMGTFSKSQNGFVKSFTEHEIVYGFISARADLNYQQGLNRMWSRSTRFDFYWPSFAHLGEQAILNKEIFAQGSANPTEDADVFGYQERFAEYRYKPSQVTSVFRSNATASLDTWHLSQDFAALPALDEDFVVEAPPIDRIVAVTSEPNFLVDVYIDLKHARPMPTYATPGGLLQL